MLLPITHYLYLALALFCVGLAGALLRRSLIAALLGIQLMIASVALLFSAYARFFADANGQLIALAIVFAGLIELAIAIAVVMRAVRAEQAEGRTSGLLDDWHTGGSS